MTLLRGAAGAVLLLALALAAIATPAQAAITSSQVTSSEAATYDYARFTAGGVAADNTRTISGTAVGNASDPIDVLCVDRDGGTEFTFGSTTLKADGTWTLEGVLSRAEDPCSPRAVAPGAGDLAPFGPGPQIFSGRTETLGAGGELHDWGVDAEPRLHGWADYYSLGSCGLCDVRWRDDAGKLSSYLWYYNASVGSTYEYDADAAGPGPNVTLPLATVDGKRAYAPDNVQNDNGEDDPAFVGLTFEHEVDQATGDATTRSTEALMTCSATCNDGVADTGIRVDRTIVNTREGQVYRITDVWRNTSGGARDLSLGYMNSQSGGTTGVQLPGESDFSARRNQVVPLADQDAATLVVKSEHTNPIHPLTNPVGTITAAPVADDVVFTDSPTEFLLRYGFSLAPGASRTITQVYAMGGTLEDTKALGAEEEDAVVGPSVAIASPADGSTVDTSSVAVTGTASDNAGVSSVTVNGVAAALKDGAWSATVPLTQGDNTIKAVATDAAGNTATAARKVVFTPKAAPGVVVVNPPVVLPKPLAMLLRKAGRAKATGRRSVLVDTGLDVICPAGGPACTAAVSATAPLPVKVTRKSKKGRSAATKRRRATVGRKSLRIPAGRTQRIRIRLSRAASQELRRRGSLTMALKVVLRAGTAAATTSSQSISVKAPAGKRSRKRG